MEIKEGIQALRSITSQLMTADVKRLVERLGENAQAEQPRVRIMEDVATQTANLGEARPVVQMEAASGPSGAEGGDEIKELRRAINAINERLDRMGPERASQQAPGKKAKRKGAKGEQGQTNSGDREAQVENGEVGQEPRQAEWSKVVGRGGAKNQSEAGPEQPARIGGVVGAGRAERRAPVAKTPRILVKTGEARYRETLDKLKAGIMGGAHEKDVKGARRSIKNDLVLELTPGADAGTMIGEVNRILGEEKAELTTGSLAQVEIKGMDETGGEKEIREGLTKLTGGKGEFKVIWVRQYGPNLRIALVEAAAEMVKGWLQEGVVRVGFTLCTIQPRREKPIPCFRCREYGHKVGSCRGKDLRNTCRRCGGLGHMEKACEADPKCVACEGRGWDSRHFVGSASCQAYQEARDKGEGKA